MPLLLLHHLHCLFTVFLSLSHQLIFLLSLTPPFPVFLSVIFLGRASCCHSRHLSHLHQSSLLTVIEMIWANHSFSRVNIHYWPPRKGGLGWTGGCTMSKGVHALLMWFQVYSTKHISWNLESFDLNSTAGEKVSASIIKILSISHSLQRQHTQQQQKKRQEMTR